MKPIKMFVLAALAALMAMAFVGASSAMAESTELCGKDPGTEEKAPCPNGVEAVIHVHETSVGKAILLASPKIECNVLFLGEVTPGSPLVTEGNFTYSSCGSGCSVTEEGGPSVIAVLRTGHETAKVTGEGEVHVNCIGINCFYNGENLAGTAKGPLLSSKSNPNGEVSIQEQTVNKTKGTFCPATGKLDITTTPLEPTYIGKGGAAHSCIEYEHPNKGWYTNNTCTALGTTRSNAWMLVVGPGNSHECYRQIREPKGLWIDSNCTMDETGATLWEYEKVK